MSFKACSFIRKELSLRILFSGNFQSNCSFEQMFWEEHYNITLSKQDSTTDVLRNMFRLLFGTAISQSSSERLHVRNIYLHSEPNNYCGGAVQGQLSELTRRNTTTSLVKFHKGLKGACLFVRTCFAKKLV